MMKKLDSDFEEPDKNVETSDGENYPTAVYTVYNVHGEPIGHRMYSYQPVYEPEDEDLVEHHEDIEYDEESESDDLPHVTVLKGGLFPDHDIDGDDENNINKLKHQYFERYVDKRRKRFLTPKTSEEIKKELDIELIEADSNKLEHTTGIDGKKDLDIELQSDESKITKSIVRTTVKPRVKRDVVTEETDRELWTAFPTKELELNEIINDMLKVIPLETKSDDLEKEMAVIPLQHNKTNSTEVSNLLDKKDKRTSRKTDRLNQTTASVPKT